MPKIITANPNGSETLTPSEQARRRTAFHTLNDSLIRQKILTGMVSSIGHSKGEKEEETFDYITVLYDNVPVIIPLEKMGFTDRGSATKHIANVTANSMAGAEIDFIVEHVDVERGVVTASREKAMKQKARDFYIGDDTHAPLVKEGSLVEARIIGVMQYSVRIEVFGIEKYIKSRELARKWISDCRNRYEIGGTIIMRVLKIDVNDNNINIEIEGAAKNDNFKTTCVVGGRYVGEVTGYNDGIFFISLDEGSNAIAHANAAVGELPRQKDVVAMVATKIMPDGQTVGGKIARIIKRYRGN